MSAPETSTPLEVETTVAMINTQAQIKIADFIVADRHLTPAKSEPRHLGMFLPASAAIRQINQHNLPRVSLDSLCTRQPSEYSLNK